MASSTFSKFYSFVEDVGKAIHDLQSGGDTIKILLTNDAPNAGDTYVDDAKDLIRDAIYRDFSVALKVQTGLVAKSIAALRIEHRWGIGVKEHHYYIGGIEDLRDRLVQLADTIDTQYHFPTELVDADGLLELVYDDILRKGGFIE